MHGLASPPLDALMNAATFVGSDWVLAPATVAIACALAWNGRRSEAAFLAVALAGSVIVNSAMKLYFHRARPALSWAHALPDYSFPSGHSMNSLAFGLALAFVAWRLAGPRRGLVALVAAASVSAIIGLSRIYLGYHYATDVIGGFAGAILWVVIVVAVLRPGGRLRRRAAADPGGERERGVDGERGGPPGELRGS
jgi:undecaprenyl-diphosphatase